MNGDLLVSGSLLCKGINTESLYSKGTVHTTSSLTTTDITSDTLSVDELTISSISPINSQIIIEADVILEAPPETSSFLELKWMIFSHEDFEKNAEGWSSEKRKSCNENYDFFLQGNGEKELEKTFKLPLHSNARISASIHFIDAWNGESVYMKVNGNIVWIENAVSGSLNICGNEENDAGYAVPLDIEIRKPTKALTISFGSTGKNTVFGIDDLIIQII